MPQLGEITAFTIATPDLEVSLQFYKMLGFREVMRADWPFPWIQVTDGVVLIMLRKDPKPYMALTYYTKEIDKVAKDLVKKGITFTQKPGAKDMVKRYLFTSPDGCNISLVGMIDGFTKPAGKGMLHMPQEDYFRPEKYPNKAIGLFGEFAQPVKDIDASMAFWKLLGFDSVSEFTSPYRWAIMTDGLAVVGLHESAHFNAPAITYFAADMQLRINRLKANGLQNYKEQGGGNVALTTPEEQQIFLFQLGGDAAEVDKSSPLDGLTQVEIETERLLLRELNPEIMEQVFTSFEDDEIVSFLGLTTENELETEKNNFAQGLTSYRSSFKAFLLVEKASGRIIGRAGFHTWAKQHSRAELGYHISNDADKNKGYMKEALAAIIDFGFTNMRLNRIEALLSKENTPSLRLVQGFGFTEEGLLRSHYFKNNRMEDSAVFSLLQSEYKPGK